MTKDVREWWVDTENDESWPFDSIDGSETGMIHVIAKSDYDLLKVKAEKLVEALEQIKIEGCLDTITTTCYDALKEWRGE